MQEENKETMELMREPLIKTKRTESLTIVKPENKKPSKKVMNNFYNPIFFFSSIKPPLISVNGWNLFWVSKKYKLTNVKFTSTETVGLEIIIETECEIKNTIFWRLCPWSCLINSNISSISFFWWSECRNFMSRLGWGLLLHIWRHYVLWYLSRWLKNFSTTTSVFKKTKKQILLLQFRSL